MNELMKEEEEMEREEEEKEGEERRGVSYYYLYEWGLQLYSVFYLHV